MGVGRVESPKGIDIHPTIDVKSWIGSIAPGRKLVHRCAKRDVDPRFKDGHRRRGLAEKIAPGMPPLAIGTPNARAFFPETITKAKQVLVQGFAIRHRKVQKRRGK